MFAAAAEAGQMERVIDKEIAFLRKRSLVQPQGLKYKRQPHVFLFVQFLCAIITAAAVAVKASSSG